MRRGWERRSAREKAIFVATAAVIGFALLWRGAAAPFEDSLDALRARIESEEILLTKFTLRSGKGDAAVAGPSASTDEEMSRLIDALGAAAQRSSVRLADVKPQAVAARDSFDEYAVDVQAEGPWPSLARFLYELQSSPLLLRVPRFRLATVRGPEGTTRMRLALEVARDIVPRRADRPRPAGDIPVD